MMSIYASTVWFGDEDPDGRGPIVYQGSHVMPSDDDPRSPAVFDLAEIPGFLRRDGADDEELHGETVRPWLRWSVNHETVVLDESQVREVHEYLGGWLKRVKT